MTNHSTKKIWSKPSLTILVDSCTNGLGKARDFPAAYENAGGSHVIYASSISHFTNTTRNGSRTEHWEPNQGSRITSNHLGFGPS